MKLLVLGSSSQLGRELIALLGRQGVAHEALSTGELDLLKQGEVLKTLGRVKPDQVINVSAYSNLEKAETDPEAARLCDILNTRGVSCLAEACAKLETPLIHHSSSHVFDGLKKTPYKEDDATNPVGRYGMSKWYGERAIRDSQPRHIILRTDWIFSVHRNNLFLRHIEACRERRGGTQVMDHRFSPTPAEDVARVLLAIARQVDCRAEVWGTYHYCALQPLTEAQFVEHFLREAAAWDEEIRPYADQLQIHVVPPEKPYIPNSSLNCQKIMETFGVKQRSRAAGLTYVLEDIYGIRHAPVPPPGSPPEKLREPEEDTSGAATPAGGKAKRKAKAVSPSGRRRPARKGAGKKSSPSP